MIDENLPAKNAHGLLPAGQPDNLRRFVALLPAVPSTLALLMSKHPNFSPPVIATASLQFATHRSLSPLCIPYMKSNT